MTANWSANQTFLECAAQWMRAVLEQRCAVHAAPSSATAVRVSRAAVDAAAAADGVIFTLLASRFGLSSFEGDLLLLAALTEVDTSVPALIAAAQGDASKRAPTFALAMSLFDEPAWDAMSPARPLRAHQLLEIHQSGSSPLLSAPLRIDERIAAFIKGVNYLDERLAARVMPLPECGALPPSQEVCAEALARWSSLGPGTGPAQLVGTHIASKCDIVARACFLAGRDGFTKPADGLPHSADDLATFVALWSREARLQPVTLLVENADDAVEPLAGEPSKLQPRASWHQALRQMTAPCLVDVRQAVPSFEGTRVFVVEPPTEDERRDCWREALAIDGTAPDESMVIRLAGEFRTSVSELGRAAARARAAAPPWLETRARVHAAAAHAWTECVRSAGATLAGVTRWIEPRVTMDQVKLPAIEKAQLERLVAHARHRSVVAADYGFSGRGERGLGLTALFFGESGTGKTFAAEAVAHALGLGLAVTELASVQSKYIGETEKNLRRIFDAAEEGGAVLFFDEADALFGKRSEVKDSHDRYANIEVNYLLARMEQFKGVAILATNQKHALDRAFMRRLQFVIGFPFPGATERQAIWQSVFPPQTPLADLDYERLARFALSGGNIFNAAIAAAHDAAADEVARVTMRHVLDAVRWELRKIDRPLADAAFREAIPTGALA